MNSKNVVLGNIDGINREDSVDRQNVLYKEKDGRVYFYLFNMVFVPPIKGRWV